LHVLVKPRSVTVMFCWTLLTGNTADTPYLMGVTDDLAVAQRMSEPHLLSGRAFLSYIEAVRPAMRADGLDSCYVRTGLTWLGRLTTGNQVAWSYRDTRGWPEPLPLR
jgi:hypothetical protein